MIVCVIMKMSKLSAQKMIHQAFLTHINRDIYAKPFHEQSVKDRINEEIMNNLQHSFV